jgi:AraC-like DNA-binding protein
MRKGFVSDRGEGLWIDHMIGASVMPYSHLHPKWELYFCPECVGQSAVINGVGYTFRHPCAILSKPYTVHSMSCVEDGFALFERFVFSFGEETVSSFGETLLPPAWLEDCQGMLFELTRGEANYLKQMLRLTMDGTYPATEPERELLLCFFVHKLFDFCAEDRITKVGSSAFYVQEVLRYLAEHIGEQVSADELAGMFAVSRSKLDRDFKQAVGMTVHEFSDICRLNFAKMLLRNKQKLSVGEIAERCGFRNETYFFAFFKKHTGVVPSEYRRRRSDPDESSLNHDCLG